MLKILGLIGLMALASCAAQPAIIPAPVPVYIHACPTVPTYTPTFEKAAGTQLAALPAGSPLIRMTEDYLAVRAEIVACNK